MSKPTIIFILNSIQQQRCIKRINEFIDNGYPIRVYGFSRLDIVPNKPDRFNVEVLAHLTNGSSYFSRLRIMRDKLRDVFASHKGENVIYYYFMLDVAMACRSLSRAPFIFEESDLAHTTLRKPFITWMLEKIDRQIIRRSLLTVFTSEGFVRYHFGNRPPENCVLIPNRLNSTILSLPLLPHHNTDINHLQIGFVGGARYKSILRFAETIAHRFPQHTFHFFGTLMSELDRLEKLKSYPNIVFYGPFANPADLPDIYSRIDLLVSTYDVEIANVRFAEPNKLYEGAYFDVPIIVSEGTFLAEKVRSLGIGYGVDARSEKSIADFINRLTYDDYYNKQQAASRIDKSTLINHNEAMFKKLGNLLQQ